MAFDEHLTEFNGQPVQEYNGPEDWHGPQVAYRLREEYDDELSVGQRLASLLSNPGAAGVRSLLIGAWAEAYESEPASFLNELIAAGPSLPSLTGLFFGDITYEECEISWIKQSDIAPLLHAFPKLEVFRVRGGDGLSITPYRHESLRSLRIETGGLPTSVLLGLFACEFPALEQLELLFGEEHYGFDGSVEDLQPLLSGELFPKLKTLGLMNSSIANDIASVIANTPVVQQIESLDLSMGNLDDEGARSLLALASCRNLRKLDFSHHYVSEELVSELKQKLPFSVIAEDRQDLEEDWRPVLHAE